MRGGAAGKFLNDKVKLGKFLAAEPFAEDDLKLSVFFSEKSQIAFRTANVASENHRASTG